VFGNGASSSARGGVYLTRRHIFLRNITPTFLRYDMDRMKDDESKSSSVVVRVFVAVGACVPSRYLATNGGGGCTERQTAS
jgi:hypothetical protein